MEINKFFTNFQRKDGLDVES